MKGEGGKTASGSHGAMGPLGAAEKAASTAPTATVFDEPLEEAFPDPAKAVYSELISAGNRSQYEAVQTDSSVEQRFVRDRLEVDDEPVKLYFRFPGSFKIRLPKMIGGNYNPDRGICVDLSLGKTWIVRETKGNEDILRH